MTKRQAKPYGERVKALMAEKSRLLSKAQAFAELGMGDMARTLWASAADHEERLAPVLEALGHDLEAAVHRVSAAGCYRRAGDPSAAVNLYRSALAGPLLKHSRQEVEKELAACLAEISRTTLQSAPRRHREPEGASPPRPEGSEQR